MTRVVVAGAAGRMGAVTCDAVEAAEDLELVARADPALGVELAEVVAEADVVVDFTRPDQALPNAGVCVGAGAHLVIGTTGFSIDQLRADVPAGGPVRVLVAPNFAIGAVLMMRFAAEAARLMEHAEIVEVHHPAKVDKPSGTAARTAQLIAEATGGAEPEIHSLRMPGRVADQEVVLGAQGQTLTIAHHTTDRTSFMPGVLLAVRGVGSLPDPVTVGLEHLLFPPGA